jgi:hypothetical protein
MSSQPGGPQADKGESGPGHLHLNIPALEYINNHLVAPQPDSNHESSSSSSSLFNDAFSASQTI